MAHTVESSVQNPASRLRASILALESAAVAPTAASLEDLLLQLDATQAAIADLEAQGVDLRAERVRWDNLTNRIASRPALVARPAAALPGGLEALRSRHGKSIDSAPWWGADVTLSKRRRRVGVEIVAILVGIPLVLVAAYFLFSAIFPPDPVAVAILEVEATIDQAVVDGDLAAALPAARAAWEANPDRSELAAWVAVLATEAGDAELAADAAAAAALLLADDPVMLALTYADHNARIGNAAASLDYARDALALDELNAMAWYQQGRAARMLGDRALALQSLARASELAMESSPELSVNARVMYGDILQQPDLSALGGVTQTVPLTSGAPLTLPAP